jgi:two-component system LytT family response regulator
MSAAANADADAPAAPAAPNMPPLRALIVDDEEPGRVNLRYALAEYPRWHLAGECASVAAARALLAAEPVDLVLLDVQMPQESGLALARELCQLAEPPLLVFVTAFNAYAVEAFEVHALDYLLKPIDDQRLAQALERAEAMLAQRQRAAYGQAVRAFLAAQDAARPAAPAAPAKRPRRRRSTGASSTCARWAASNASSSTRCTG